MSRQEHGEDNEANEQPAWCGFRFLHCVLHKCNEKELDENDKDFVTSEGDYFKLNCS